MIPRYGLLSNYAVEHAGITENQEAQNILNKAIKELPYEMVEDVSNIKI